LQQCPYSLQSRNPCRMRMQMQLHRCTNHHAMLMCSCSRLPSCRPLLERPHLAAEADAPHTMSHTRDVASRMEGLFRAAMSGDACVPRAAHRLHDRLGAPRRRTPTVLYHTTRENPPLERPEGRQAERGV